MFARKSRFVAKMEEIVAKKDMFAAAIHSNVAKTPAIIAGNGGATSLFQHVRKLDPATSPKVAAQNVARHVNNTSLC